MKKKHVGRKYLVYHNIFSKINVIVMAVMLLKMFHLSPSSSS